VKGTLKRGELTIIALTISLSLFLKAVMACKEEFKNIYMPLTANFR